MRWTDPTTHLEWNVIDYVGERGHRKRVSLGSWRAEGRAFVPIGREAPVMLYVFDLVPHRDGDDRVLLGQLSAAKPSRAKQGERMQRNDITGSCQTPR